MLQILQKYKSTHNNCILYIETEPQTPYRTHNIARARNKCLDIIRNNFIDYEYFIMIDCDEVCSEPVNLEYILYYFLYCIYYLLKSCFCQFYNLILLFYWTIGIIIH